MVAIRKKRRKNTPLYRYWQALYMAFYSRRLYVDVIRQWRGFGAGYVLFVITLASIPLSISMISEFNQYFDEQLVLPFKKLPTFVIKDGNVLFNKPMPYYVKSNGEVVSIIDTTGKIKNIDETPPMVNLLITKDKIYFRQPAFNWFSSITTNKGSQDIYEQSIAGIDYEVFNGTLWLKESGVLRLKRLAQITTYPVIIASIYSFYLVVVPVLAFLGQVIAQAFFQLKLTYKDACRVLAVSATPEIICFFIFFTLNLSFRGEGFFLVALLAMYFSYAVLAIKRERTKLVIR